MEKFKKIINDFARNINLRGLNIDPTGYCCLDVDNGTLIHLKYFEKRNLMYMIAEIAELPDKNRAAVMRYLLRMNGNYEETKGFTLSYNSESGKAALGYHYPLRFMTEKIFEDKFKLMIDETQRWAAIVKTFLEGKIPPGEKSTPGGNILPKPKPKEDPKTEEKRKTDTKPKSEPKSEPKPEPKPNQETKPEPKPKPKPKPKLMPKPKPKLKPESESTPEANPNPLKSKQRPVPKPKIKPEPKTEEEPNNEFIKFLDVSEIESYEQLDIIGRGSASEVYKVSNDGHHVYAMKVFLPDVFETINDDGVSSSQACDIENMRQFLKDYEILNMLNHPNFVKAYGICLGDETHSLSILLEYCPSNLNNEALKMDKPKMTATIYEIARSMKHVHSLNIIHRDLKPENILFDEHKHVKISDFGTAAIIENDNMMLSRTKQVGSSLFMAPELVNESTHYNEKIDVYSFGVLMYFILTGGRLPKINFMQIGLGKKAKIPNTINKFSSDIINNCWEFDPKNRPSFADIVELIEKNQFKLIDGVEKDDILDIFAQ